VINPFGCPKFLAGKSERGLFSVDPNAMNNIYFILSNRPLTKALEPISKKYLLTENNILSKNSGSLVHIGIKM